MSMARQIEQLSAPLLVTWQITRDCDLCCLHCCTESAPGKKLPDELDADEAMGVARAIISNNVPYVMLCGGEPLVSPYFFMLAETLGNAGVQLKIETNGQRFDETMAARLARLPVRSVQISLDGDTQPTFARQRPGASLSRAHAACRAVVAAGIPLEVTFAPTRLNIHEAEAVIAHARALGAFRFNTGMLMRVGTAARLWDRLAPDTGQYREFHAMLDRNARILGGKMELCYAPFSLGEGLRRSLEEPPATLLVLPNGRVKIAAALPHTCADLRRETFAQAWESYRRAWRNDAILAAVRRAVEDESSHVEANAWRPMQVVNI